MKISECPYCYGRQEISTLVKYSMLGGVEISLENFNRDFFEDVLGTDEEFEVRLKIDADGKRYLVIKKFDQKLD